ncbi:MAG TPA: pepsin/retropepsin-like aspartic protease family protein, partial [Chryseosolibacter sp.]
MMIRLYLLTVVFSLFSIPLYSQTLGFSLADGKRKVEIPIEIYNNLIVVPVVLNGALPLKFILDTGVRTAILTEKTFTDILNLAYSRKYTISGPGGEQIIDAYITNNVSLELPGVTGRGHALLVLGQDYLELRNYLGTDVHGILGYELFSRFIIEVDYEKRMLTLSVPSRFMKKRKFQSIPIKIEDTKPYVTTSVVLADGTQLTAKLLVDSGASHGLMLEPTSDPRIKVPDSAVSSIIGRGLGGEITGKVGRIKSLKLGTYDIKNAIANFPDPNSYFDSLKLGATARNGAIGGEVLSRFTVIFNFPTEEIYLKKNSSFKKKFHYNLSGLT